MSPAGPNQPFQVLGMAVVGLANTTLTLHAYNHGTYVGSKSYPLSPVLTPIRIPAEWGQITQVTFVCTDRQRKASIFNLWSVTLQ